MLEYKINLLDEYGHVFRTGTIGAFSDEQALAKATRLGAGSTVEVWQYARVVGRISPPPAPMALIA